MFRAKVLRIQRRLFSTFASARAELVKRSYATGSVPPTVRPFAA